MEGLGCALGGTEVGAGGEGAGDFCDGGGAEGPGVEVAAAGGEVDCRGVRRQGIGGGIWV